MKTFTFAPSASSPAAGTDAMATIKDVAREAKVSVASVSRALNGNVGVTAQTALRIHAVAQRLRYIPHGGARSLITRRTHTVGALLPDLHGEFFSELIRGIDLAARARGLHLLVSSSHDGADDAAAALRAMQGRVDGMLILSARVDVDFLRANLSESVPTVLLNSPVRDSAYRVLNMDNHAGAYHMVEHLIGLGHTDIAFIGGPSDNFDAQQRERGYRDAMAAFAPGMTPRVVAGQFTEASGYAAGQTLLALPQPPRAVFAANDIMAVGCQYALQQAGLSVPRDVALAGFDDIPIARYLSPSLSTVRVRIAELGQLALELLAGCIAEPERSAVPVRTLACDIVVRESCGATASTTTTTPIKKR